MHPSVLIMFIYLISFVLLTPSGSVSSASCSKVGGKHCDSTVLIIWKKNMSEFLRLGIFIVYTIYMRTIFIVVIMTFQTFCPLAFIRGMPRWVTYGEFRTEPFNFYCMSRLIPAVYPDQHTSDEGQMPQQPKRCDHNKNEDNSQHVNTVKVFVNIEANNFL